MANVVDLNAARLGRQDIIVEGRVPAHDLEAEAAVISNVLLASTTSDGARTLGGLAVVKDMLTPTHFYSEAHRWTYEAALELDRESKPVDVVTVSGWLRDRQRLAQVGGMEYLNGLLNSAPSCAIASLRQYATVVHEKWRVRQAVSVMQTESARGYFDYGDPQDYIESAAKQLGRIAALGIGDKPRSFFDTLIERVRAIRDAAAAQGKPNAEKMGIPFGIPSLDALTYGMHRRGLTLVVAPSGAGKTTFALNVALHVALLGIGVLVFSPEIPQDDIVDKALCNLAQAPIERVKNGNLSPRQWDRLFDFVRPRATPDGKTLPPRAKSMPLVIDDRRELHVGQICARAKSVAELMPTMFTTDDGKPAQLGLVIVDHLHHLGAAPGAPLRRGYEKYDSLYNSARRFKGLLDELDVTGILLAQMRAFDERVVRDEAFRPPQQSVEHCKAVDQVASSTINLWVPWHKSNGAWVQDRSRVIVSRVKKRSGSYGEFVLECVHGEDRYLDEAGEIDDTVNKMIPPTRAMVNQPDPRLPSERDDDPTPEYFNTEGMR